MHPSRFSAQEPRSVPPTRTKRGCRCCPANALTPSTACKGGRCKRRPKENCATVLHAKAPDSHAAKPDAMWGPLAATTVEKIHLFPASYPHLNGLSPITGTDCHQSRNQKRSPSTELHQTTAAGPFNQPRPRNAPVQGTQSKGDKYQGTTVFKGRGRNLVQGGLRAAAK